MGIRVRVGGLEEDHAKGIDVNPRCVLRRNQKAPFLVGLEDFRGLVSTGSHGGGHLAPVIDVGATEKGGAASGLPKERRQAKVADFGVPRRVDQDIIRFEVAVDDGGVAGVQVMDPRAAPIAIERRAPHPIRASP